MRLNYFVYKNPNTLEYKVIDLSIPYKCDLSHCLKDIPQKIEIDKNYITNILQYIKECGETLSYVYSDLMYDYYVWESILHRKVKDALFI